MNMTPPHPGLFLRTEVIDELGVSITQAADILGVRPADLSDLLDCKVALSPEMALRMEKAFGVGMELMLRLQAWYDTVQMRARWDEVEVERYPPVEELLKLREEELALLESPSTPIGD